MSDLLVRFDSFILPTNEYDCVYAWTTLGNIVTDRLTEDADFGKKNYLFRRSSFWSWRLCKQAKLSHLWHKKPARIHWKRVSVWCSFWSRGIIGPFFFENEQGKAVTVNGDNYRTMLNEFLFTNIEEENIGNIWFQQDGATCHTAEATLDVLRPVFEDRIISRSADVVWPPRSCDLTPSDYYLWGAFKDKSYDNWSFKGQYSWSHWWNAAAHNR